jgi:hypothetical protein
MTEYSSPIPNQPWLVTYAEQPTLRDQFAIAALTGLLASCKTHRVDTYVRDAYQMADAMIEARKEKK